MQTGEKNQGQQSGKAGDADKSPNKIPAAKQAEADIAEDLDMQPDTSKTADLDEGELARADNSND